MIAVRSTMAWLLAVLMLTLCSAVASADESTPWVGALKGGVFEPDLEDYATFYGDSRTNLFALNFGYQFRPWLELGGQLGGMRDSGVGLQPVSGQLGGSVEYTLLPAHLYVNFIGKRNQKQLLVPYAGVGLTTAWYRQEIANQETREGRTDLGYNATAGVMLLLDRLDPGSAYELSPDGGVQTYLTFDVQWFSTEVDGIDLGGLTYLLGLRFEWGRARRP